MVGVGVEGEPSAEPEPAYEQRFAPRVGALRDYAASQRGEDVDLGVIRDQLAWEISPVTESEAWMQKRRREKWGQEDTDNSDAHEAYAKYRELAQDAVAETLARVFDGVRTDEGVVRGFTKDVLDVNWGPPFIGIMLEHMEDEGWLERDYSEGTLAFKRDLAEIR